MTHSKVFIHALDSSSIQVTLVQYDHKLSDYFLGLMSRQGFVYDINYNQEFTIFNRMADTEELIPKKRKW